MKTITIWMIFLFFSARALAGGAAGLCFPKDDPEGLTEDWPICAVYLHGLFGQPPYSVSTWEIPFRKKLQKIAVQKKCRIAVPFGNQGKYRNWNGVSLEEISRRAEKACSGAEYAEQVAVIGFSNGANRLRRIGGANCENLARFAKVTLIGPTGEWNNSRVRKCKNVMIHQAHEVPSLSYLSDAIPYEELDNESPRSHSALAR